MCLTLYKVCPNNFMICTTITETLTGELLKPYKKRLLGHSWNILILVEMTVQSRILIQ